MSTRCGEQVIYLKWKQNLFSHALVEKALAQAWKDLVSVLTKHLCHSLLMWNNNTLFRNEENHTVNCRQDGLEISVFLVIISKKREISPLFREGWLNSENRVCTRSYLTALPEPTSKHRDIRLPNTSVVPGEYVEENHLGTVYKKKKGNSSA